MSPSRPDTTDMIVLHNAFRREFGLLPALVAGVAPGDRDRARTVVEHLDTELTALHDHHEGEDLILWPALLQTPGPDPDLVHTMQTQHDQLDALLDTARTARNAWLAGLDAGQRAALVDALTGIAPALSEHLDLEESRILPLVERYLTEEDWQRLADESRRRLPSDPRRQLVLLGILLEDADRDQQRVIYSEMPVAARLVWRSAGQPLYRRYVHRLRGPLEAGGAGGDR